LGAEGFGQAPGDFGPEERVGRRTQGAAKQPGGFGRVAVEKGFCFFEEEER
jgi:hypothetical protein